LVQEHSEAIDGKAAALTGGADEWGEVLSVNGVIDSLGGTEGFEGKGQGVFVFHSKTSGLNKKIALG
jgi:hypothetical protein